MLPDAWPKFTESPVTCGHSPLSAKFMMSQSMTLLSRRGSPTGIEPVVPVAGAGAHDARRRAVAGVLAVVRGRVEVVADIELQRRVAVAEDVVGDAETRRDVVERIDAGRPREADRRRVEG